MLAIIAVSIISFVLMDILLNCAVYLRSIDYGDLNRQKHYDAALENWRTTSKRYADEIEKLAFDYRLKQKELNAVYGIAASCIGTPMYNELKDAIKRLDKWSDNDTRPYLNDIERDALKLLDII